MTPGVASLLRPGGRLLLRDDDPMFMTVAEDVSERLRKDPDRLALQCMLTAHHPG